MLEHLLRDFRSAALRKRFFSHDTTEYTDTLDVKLLVSSRHVCRESAQQRHTGTD